MTYAHIAGDTFTLHARHPTIENDGVRDWDLRDPTIRLARGWLEVTETPRPDPIEGGVWESNGITGVQLVDGLPVRAWTWRPWTAEELAAQAQAMDRVAALEAIVVGNLPTPAEGEEPTFADLTARQAGAIFDGQKFVWTDGNVWQASLGPMNSQATPATYPQGYAQLTGLPPDVSPWIAGEAVTVGDLRTYNGTVYRVTQSHTTQSGWEPPNVPALWTPQS